MINELERPHGRFWSVATKTSVAALINLKLETVNPVTLWRVLYLKPVSVNTDKNFK